MMLTPWTGENNNLKMRKQFENEGIQKNSRDVEFGEFSNC